MNPSAPKPWLAVTPVLMEKAAVSISTMAVGMFYLTTGRRDADMGRMITGAILALVSLFIFLI